MMNLAGLAINRFLSDFSYQYVPVAINFLKGSIISPYSD